MSRSLRTILNLSLGCVLGQLCTELLGQLPNRQVQQNILASTRNPGPRNFSINLCVVMSALYLSIKASAGRLTLSNLSFARTRITVAAKQ